MRSPLAIPNDLSSSVASHLPLSHHPNANTLIPYLRSISLRAHNLKSGRSNDGNTQLNHAVVEVNARARPRPYSFSSLCPFLWPLGAVLLGKLSHTPFLERSADKSNEMEDFARKTTVTMKIEILFTE